MFNLYIKNNKKERLIMQTQTIKNNVDIDQVEAEKVRALQSHLGLTDDEVNEMTLEEMDKIMTSSRVMFVTKMLKWKYNRARPAQIAPELINEKNGTLLHSDSAATPAYPSGHAVQTYYLAKILSRRFPAKTQAVMEIATKCANIRIMAGHHYPSDRDFGWWVVDRYLTDV